MTLTRISKIAFLTLIFLLPLFFLPWGYESYVVPKSILLKIGVSISAILLIADFFRAKKIDVKITKKQIYWVLAFLLILGISMLTAVRPQMSFFGEYGRQGGIWNMLFYIMIFILSLHFFKNKTDRINILKIVSISGFIVSIYAILQKLGLDIFPKETVAIFEGRSFSTLGNPTMLGAYLLFPIWSEVALFANTNKKYRGKNVAFLVVMLIALVCTRNRASILALLGSGILFFLHHFRHKKKLIITTIALGLIALIGFVSIYGSNTRSMNSRFIIWESSLEIIENSPIFGYGLESYQYLFEHHTNPEIFEYEDYYTIVDRPHNEILEFWINLGIFGLIFYLALIGICFKKFLRTKDSISYFASLGIGALIISNLFSFSLVTQYSFFALFLGITFADNQKKNALKNTVLSKVIAAVLLIFLIASIIASTSIFVSNLKIKKGYEGIETLGLTESVKTLEEGVRLDPFYSKPMQTVMDFYYEFATALDNQYFYQAAVEKSAKIAAIQHNDMQATMNEAHLAILAKDYDRAEELFNWIYEEIGTHPLLFEEWADLYFKQGEYAKAALIYDQYLAIMPDDWQTSTLSEDNMTDEQRIFWKNHPNFGNILEQIILTYTYTGNFEKLNEINSVLK